MNEIKFRAWDEYHEKLVEVASIDFDNGICLVRDVEGDVYSVHRDNLALMQYVGMHDEENLTDIWDHDLLETESPKGKFVAEVVKCYGTFGIVGVNEGGRG